MLANGLGQIIGRREFLKYAIALLASGCAGVQVKEFEQVKEEKNFFLKSPRYTLIKYSYEIHNQSSETIKALEAFLSIPPDTVSQRIIDFKLDSTLEPEIVYDKWGQKIAHYRLEEIKLESKIILSWTAKTEIREIKYNIAPKKVGYVFSSIPDPIFSNYTADGCMYQLKNPIIQDKARAIIGKETNIFYKARKIHDFVIDHMKPTSPDKWKTAPELLEKGYGSCSEYTFLFIALCRASGIPARYVGGSTRLESGGKYNDDILHRWAEIYFPNYGWIPVDVTWNDRPQAFYQYLYSLSNRHFTMYVGGGDSEYLGWYYDSNIKGVGLKGKVRVKRMAEWIPLSKKEAGLF